MNARPLPQDDALLDLLATRAVEGLDANDERTLRAQCRAMGLDDPPEDFDVAAAALELAYLRPEDMTPMPADVTARLLAKGEAYCAAVAPGAIPFPASSSRSVAQRLMPWLVAASLALAAVAWLTYPTPAPPRLDGNDMVRVLASAPDAVTLPWGEWSDDSVKAECPGVRGKVVWSESLQRGYMVFEGLPANARDREQYQLWIVDSRGMSQRISGGIFDAAGQGEIVVPITPAIAVKNAAAFAVTIEAPGGTWVSDMSRRVVIAAKG